MNQLSFSAWTLAACALLAGAVVPLQAASNAALAKQLGHPLWASLASLVVSILVLVFLLWAFQAPKPTISMSGLFSQPIWIWFGGVAGMIYITSALILVPKMGGTTFFVLVIAGQLILAALLDYFGWMNIPKQDIGFNRILGITLVLAGVACIQLWPKK